MNSASRTSSEADTFYRARLEKNAYTTVLIYCGLIVFLLPAFHFVLGAVPGVPPDSLALRLFCAALSGAIGVCLLAFPKVRRYATQLQFLNVVTVLLVIIALIVSSGDHYIYIASGLLVLVGAQQAFYRPTELFAALTIGFLFQIAYSYASGILFTTLNIATIVIYGSGYIIAFATAYVRMRIQEREIISRIEAIEVRSELEQVHALTHLGNWQLDMRTGQAEWSAELLRMFRMPLDTASEALRGLYESSIHPEERERVHAAFARAERTQEPFAVEHRMIVADGAMRWVHLRGKYDFVENTPVRRLSAVLDITERKEVEARLVHLAAYDQLTGLPNRTNLEERLRSALSAETPDCAILFLDLDRFKDINDSLGHVVGDALLRAVAERMTMLLPDGAVLSRWGGDEFLIIVPNIVVDEQLERLAHQLIRAISEPFAIEQYELVITGSIGIARAPRDGTDAGVLIRNADTAMYHVKEHAREAYAFFKKSMHDAASARHQIQNELHKAIWNNRLMLHYQPIIDVKSGHVIAAEALLRWMTADGSLRQPEHFISIAEDTGEIVPIGTWALQDACRQIKTWERRGAPISVAVNVSARQLEHPEFLDTLMMILRQTDIDPSLLDIELTESALLSNTEALFETLTMIRSLGPRISIDDFGTGYSTFSYLKRFKVDALKLDGSFVNGIDRPSDRAIAESIVTVAHTLGLRVIAEGVEQENQLDILSQMRCDEAQGFFISRPVPVPEFETTISSGPLQGGWRSAL